MPGCENLIGEILMPPSLVPLSEKMLLRLKFPMCGGTATECGVMWPLPGFPVIVFIPKLCWKLRPSPFWGRVGGNNAYGGPRSGVFLLEEFDNGLDVEPKRFPGRKDGPSLCRLRTGGGDMF